MHVLERGWGLGGRGKLLALFALATALLYLYDSKRKDVVLPRIVQTVCIVIALLGVVGFFAAIFYFTFVDTKTDLGFQFCYNYVMAETLIISRFFILL